MELELELEKAVKRINQTGARRVVIQLPEGLKPMAEHIQDELIKKCGAEVLIWAGSCFGACDKPLGLENLEVDLLIQWGHSKWE
ncbi:MAG: diphthamide synthesis protein [Candidatus Nanoarchaeia archaeon]